MLLIGRFQFFEAQCRRREAVRAGAIRVHIPSFHEQVEAAIAALFHRCPRQLPVETLGVFVAIVGAVHAFVDEQDGRSHLLAGRKRIQLEVFLDDAGRNPVAFAQRFKQREGNAMLGMAIYSPVIHHHAVVPLKVSPHLRRVHHIHIAVVSQFFNGTVAADDPFCLLVCQQFVAGIKAGKVSKSAGKETMTLYPPFVPRVRSNA